MDNKPEIEKWLGEWTIVNGPDTEELAMAVISHCPTDFEIEKSGIRCKISLRIITGVPCEPRGMFDLQVEHQLPLNIITDSEPLMVVAQALRHTAKENPFIFSCFKYFLGGRGGRAVLQNIGYTIEETGERNPY